MGQARQYIDFKLYLSQATADGSQCYVSLLPTPEVGETIKPVPFSIADDTYQVLADYLEAKSTNLRNLVKLGKKLADWLLPEEIIRPRFETALEQAGQHGGVRLRLIIADQALKQVPWEYVFFDPSAAEGDSDTRSGFLALNPQISIVRHEPLPFPHPKPIELDHSVDELQMVAATASSTDMRKLAVEKEAENLQKALAGVGTDGVARINLQPVLEDVTFAELKERLQQQKPVHLFHFAGHGEVNMVKNPYARGYIEVGSLFFLEDKTAKVSKSIDSTEFADLLYSTGAWLVTLGACDSAQRNEASPWHDVAGALLKKGMPAVVAMQYEINDEAAVAFSQAFYQSLQWGLSLDEAMVWSRREMAGDLAASIENSKNFEWGVPVLYSRLPDGVLVPELVEKGKEKADSVRQVIQDEVERIIHIKQDVKNVQGNVTGIEVEETGSGSFKAKIEQGAETVEEGGTMIGAKFGKLG